jgi:toxin-antitoxin system PIN domain toxin
MTGGTDGAHTTDLPDLNVWLALACPGHPHHGAALGYWEHQAASQILFCSVTALGLVRVLCQPGVMGDAAQTPAQAAVVLHRFRAEPGVALADSEAGAWDVFHALLVGQPPLPARLCTDAYLAALAMARGWRLVSFDEDFGRFPRLTWLKPPMPA